jgi:biopolymer transport protein TolR
MVLSPLLIQGIDVNLPRTDTTKMTIQNEPLVVSIDQNGNYFINIGDEEIAIPLDDLKDKAFVIFNANPDIEVVFKGDEAADFQSVAAAMAAIQSIGITKIGIVTSGYDD